MTTTCLAHSLQAFCTVPLSILLYMAMCNEARVCFLLLAHWVMVHFDCACALACKLLGYITPICHRLSYAISAMPAVIFTTPRLRSSEVWTKTCVPLSRCPRTLSAGMPSTAPFDHRAAPKDAQGILDKQNIAKLISTAQLHPRMSTRGWVCRAHTGAPSRLPPGHVASSFLCCIKWVGHIGAQQIPGNSREVYGDSWDGNPQESLGVLRIRSL